MQTANLIFDSQLAIRAPVRKPAVRPAGGWIPLLALLLLAFTTLTAQSAELRISDAQGNPGDAIEVLLTLGGDDQTAAAQFRVSSGLVTDLPPNPATPLSPGIFCNVENDVIVVAWTGAAFDGDLPACRVRLTIRATTELHFFVLSALTYQCWNAVGNPVACSVSGGRVDVIQPPSEVERSFIAVLRDPPAAPPVQDVVEFDYSNMGVAAPLEFVDAVRPQYVRGLGPVSPLTAYGQWVLENPQSPIALLHRRGARFTFSTLEQRAQALEAARSDSAVHDVVETLNVVGPDPTYPEVLREYQPFGLFLVGLSCPRIEAATPESALIEVSGTQINLTFYSNPNEVCPGVMPPGYSGAVLQIPGLAAGTYTVNVHSGWWAWSFDLNVTSAGAALNPPSPIPNRDIRLWLIPLLLILAGRRLAAQSRS